MGIFSNKSSHKESEEKVELPSAQEKLFQTLSNKKEPEPVKPNHTNYNMTSIANGTKIEGNLNCETDLVIEGTLVGSIKCSQQVIVGKNGHVEGDIFANKVELSGKVTGKVQVKELTHLKQGTVLQGDIHTGNLIIENGVFFNGHCVMNNPSANLKPLTNSINKESASTANA